jgi:hypothetical protein
MAFFTDFMEVGLPLQDMDVLCRRVEYKAEMSLIIKHTIVYRYF